MVLGKNETWVTMDGMRDFRFKVPMARGWGNLYFRFWGSHFSIAFLYVSLRERAFVRGILSPLHDEWVFVFVSETCAVGV